MDRTERKALRTAVADYMRSEGCSCCRDYDAHREHLAVLGKLLKIKPDKDGWHDFSPYRTSEGKSDGR